MLIVLEPELMFNMQRDPDPTGWILLVSSFAASTAYILLTFASSSRQTAVKNTILLGVNATAETLWLARLPRKERSIHELRRICFFIRTLETLVTIWQPHPVNALEEKKTTICDCRL